MAESLNTLKKRHLKEQLELAIKAKTALESSYRSLKKSRLPSARELDLGLAEKFEALASRFARLVDIMTQKVFRAIEAVELEDNGTLIDRFNRMEKRRIIKNAETWQDIRDLRNQIAHEYALDTLEPLYRAIIKHCPEALDAVAQTAAYLKKQKLNK